MPFCQIVNDQPVILSGPWTDSAGNQHAANAIALNGEAWALSKGLLPLEDIPPALNDDEELAGDVLVIQADKVVRTYSTRTASYVSLRQKAYVAQGLTAEAWADAIFKRDYQDDSTDWAALCVAKAAIKAQYPKPAEE